MAVLSKSKILAYLQCPKRLWLEVNQPESRTDSSATKASFATGHSVGDVSRKIYDPDGAGIFLDINQHKLKGLISATQAALPERRIIFEAGFQANGSLSLADILIPVEHENGPAWRMVEVKSSTSVKEYHVKDLAVQSAIATQAGIRLTQLFIAHVDSSWTYPGHDNYQGLLKEQDVTAEVKELGESVTHWLSDAHLIAKEPTPPARTTGVHCFDPYECGFLTYCQSKEPQAVHPISWLPRVQSKALKTHIAAHDVQGMEDVPESLLNKVQIRVKHHTLQDTPYINIAGAKAALAMHPLPGYFLDFETINFAVPIWAGIRPYEQVPFQFSVHYLGGAHQELEHKAFLDLSGDNPMRAFAQDLVKYCGQIGPIFVYNKGFEGARIGDAIKHLQDDAQLVQALAAIKARLVDLMPITQDNYYHPSQKGSWSIKPVLKAMVPELDYKNLDNVQNGGDAQLAYLKAAGLSDENISGEDIELTRKQLLAYCERDTLAMVRIWQFFMDSSYGSENF